MPGRHAGVPPTAAPAWPRNKGVPPCAGVDVAPNLGRAELKPPGATGMPGVAPPKRCTPGGSGVPPASVPGIRPAAGVAPPHRALPAAPSGPGVPGRHPGVRPAAQGVRPPAPSAPGVAPCSPTAFQQMHSVPPSTNANRLSTYYIGILHELIVSGKGRSVTICFPGRAKTPTSMSGPGVPGRQAGVRLPARPGVRPPLPSAPGVAPAAGVAPP